MLLTEDKQTPLRGNDLNLDVSPFNPDGRVSGSSELLPVCARVPFTAFQVETGGIKKTEVGQVWTKTSSDLGFLKKNKSAVFGHRNKQNKPQTEEI